MCRFGTFLQAEIAMTIDLLITKVNWYWSTKMERDLKTEFFNAPSELLFFLGLFLHQLLRVKIRQWYFPRHAYAWSGINFF